MISLRSRWRSTTWVPTPPRCSFTGTRPCALGIALTVKTLSSIFLNSAVVTDLCFICATVLQPAPLPEGIFIPFQLLLHRVYYAVSLCGILLRGGGRKRQEYSTLPGWLKTECVWTVSRRIIWPQDVFFCFSPFKRKETFFFLWVFCIFVYEQQQKKIWKGDSLKFATLLAFRLCSFTSFWGIQSISN